MIFSIFTNIAFVEAINALIRPTLKRPITFSETLKDCESEMSALKAEIDRKSSEVDAVEERCGVLVSIQSRDDLAILA